MSPQICHPEQLDPASSAICTPRASSQSNPLRAPCRAHPAPYPGGGLGLHGPDGPPPDQLQGVHPRCRYGSGVCGWKVAVPFTCPWCSVTHSQGVRHTMVVILPRAFPAVMLPSPIWLPHCHRVAALPADPGDQHGRPRGHRRVHQRRRGLPEVRLVPAAGACHSIIRSE